MIPLIIDTDVALGVIFEDRPRDIDDGFAIVEAINSAEIDLLAVTTVFGNGPHAEVNRVANEIVQLKQASVPVYPGAHQPLPETGDLPEPNDAVVQMARILEDNRAHIAAIGPLTNLGLLAHHYPERLANIESVIIVAGRSEGVVFNIGDVGPVRDFNFENDVRAAQLLLRCGVPLVLAGFELTSQVVVTEADLAVIAQSSSPTAAYFHENSLAWCRYWTTRFPLDAGFHPWDSAAISWLKHPEYFVTQPRGWRIRKMEDNVHWLECDGEFSGGRITYCTGFRPGGKEEFIKDVVDNVF